jgi:hypothetical protein
MHPSGPVLSFGSRGVPGGLNAGLRPQRVSLEEMFGRLAASQFVSIE